MSLQPPLAVVAIGGNSLMRDNQHQSLADEQEAVHETARHIAEMVAQGWHVVVTHGNGPQVGQQLLRAELARQVIPEIPPLDIAVAETQGSIGYIIQRALNNEFHRRGLAKQAVTLITQTLVDASDPAMHTPSKPIGLFYTAEEARQKQREYGWSMLEDAGRGWRRVVASPNPQSIIEQQAIEMLARAGFVVIATGGGGIPVTIDNNGMLNGLEAVIDKDLASSHLASSLRADLLLISTGVEQVALHYHTPQQRNLGRLTFSEARRYLDEGQFARGSMEPKIRAVLEFLERGGRAALITMPETMIRALKRETGTWILPDGQPWPELALDSSLKNSSIHGTI